MQQGSEEWFAARRGVVTASRFGDAMARAGTKRRRLYLEEMRAELAGISIPEGVIEKPWFRPGKEYEQMARGYYEFMTGRAVTEHGLIVSMRPVLLVGCSPDGLVGDDGGIEIKVRTSISEHLKTIRKGMPSQYRAQVQGCMWVTNRKWWDFISFYVNQSKRSTDMHVVRIERDDKYIKRLKESVDGFAKEVMSERN